MSDFETQLKERLHHSVAKVAGSDEVFDRAADRYRAHTRNRRLAAVGGIVTAAALAIGVATVAGVIDDRPQPPILEERDPSPRDATTIVPDLVVAHDGLLDELGVPLAGHDLQRAYALGDDTWLLQSVDRTGATVVHRWRSGDPSPTRVAGTGAGDLSLDLHGWTRGPAGELVALLTRVTETERLIQQVTFMTEDAREDVVIPVRDEVVRLSAWPEPSPPTEEGAQFVLVADFGDGSDQVATFDAGGAAANGLELQDACPACSVHSVTVGGQRVAYLTLDVDGTTTLHVEELATGLPVASTQFGNEGESLLGRLEIAGDHVLVNVSPTERWHLHVPTQELKLIADERAGYATLPRTEATRAPVTPDDPEPTGPAASEDPYWLAGVPGVGSWSDIPTPPAPDGGRWRLGDPVWTGELVLGLAGLEEPEGPPYTGPPELSEALWAYDPAAGSWTQLAEPPGQGSLHWIDDRLILLGWGAGATTDDTWRTWSYDVGTDRWSEHDPFPLGTRSAHSETWTGNELIVWGGLALERGEYTTQVTTFADGAAFDPRSGTWRQLATSPLASRGDHGAVWNGRRLVVFGGGHTDEIEGEFSWSEQRDDAAVYDPATDTWTTIESPGRIGPLVAADWTGTHILAWSGNPYPEDRPFGWIWDPVAGDAVEIPEDVPARGMFNYRDDIDHEWAPEIGKWVLWGGGCTEGCNATFAHGYLFDPDTKSWDLINDPDERTGFASGSVWIGDRLLVVGGDDGRGQSTTHRRDATPRAWRP